MSEDPVSNGADGRDGAGRFAKGNTFGRGNPRLRHLAELQTAVREVGTADRLRELLDVLHARGMKGDVHAARLWIERVAGKPREAAGEALLLDVDCSTIETCRTSAASVVEAAARGDVDSDHATRLLGMLGVVVNAHEVAQIEERLAALEQQQPTPPNRSLPHAS